MSFWQRSRLGELMMIAGGLLWVPYGIFEMLEPWGTDTRYRDDLGYEEIVDSSSFIAYSLPGSLALLLTALGLLSVLSRTEKRPSKIVRLLAYTAIALGALSLVGVVAQFDPLFTSGRIFGSSALGAGTLLAGLSAGNAAAAPGWRTALLILGAMGLFLFPLWPLVHAWQWLPEAGGAAFIALFGIGWVALGLASWRQPAASPR